MRRYIAEIGARFNRRVPLGTAVVEQVNAVLSGRRNNPPEPGIRPLAVYNPIHYQELPELFMDFVCSPTGKSPSTTGAGSEGALTKTPFNIYLETFATRDSHHDVVEKLDIEGRLATARTKLKQVSDSVYLLTLRGTIGVDPLSTPWVQLLTRTLHKQS